MMTQTMILSFAENDSLSISGDFTIATNNYIQSGMVDVAGALDNRVR